MPIINGLTDNTLFLAAAFGGGLAYYFFPDLFSGQGKENVEQWYVPHYGATVNVYNVDTEAQMAECLEFQKVFPNGEKRPKPLYPVILDGPEQNVFLLSKNAIGKKRRWVWVPDPEKVNAETRLEFEKLLGKQPEKQVSFEGFTKAPTKQRDLDKLKEYDSLLEIEKLKDVVTSEHEKKRDLLQTVDQFMTSAGKVVNPLGQAAIKKPQS